MSFKVYQIHEYGGEWEDAFDYIVGSYLSEEKAITEKKNLEAEEDNLYNLYQKCCACPLYLPDKMKEYCDKYEPFDKDKHSLDEFDGDEFCVNHSWYFENTYYKIEEVEVIE